MNSTLSNMGRAAIALAAALVIGASSASATLITFDDQLPATVITSQYPDVTFSSEPGETNNTLGPYATAPSAPNIICTANAAGAYDCINDVYMDFTNPVSGLSIWAVEPNEFGVVATFYLYNGATLLGTQDLIGLSGTPGNFGLGNKFVDLTSFNNVTRMEIRGPGGSGDIDNSYSGSGIGWDDLSFTVIPEPGALGLFALATLTAAIRRRR